MTNFQDPKVQQADGCPFYAFHLPAASLTFPCSGLHEGSLCSGRSLHVSLLPNTSVSSLTTWRSWEFLTSLWFEWQIITGKRSYRWSIWVSSTVCIHSRAADLLFVAIFWLPLFGPLCHHHNFYRVQCHDSHRLQGTRRATFFFFWL